VIIVNEFDLWGRIIATLVENVVARSPSTRRAAQHGYASRNESGYENEQRIKEAQMEWHTVPVVAVEKQSDRSMLISWSDATRGHFSEQRWVSATARTSGLCALTGHAIRRGDSVYRPQRRGALCPVNCSGMILAAVLERMAERAASP
jgi:hypothetical protein